VSYGIPMAEKKTNKSGLTSADIRKFKALLLAKRSEIFGDVTYMEDETLRKPRSDLSSMPTHMADIGTDNYEIESTLGLMNGERKLIAEIDDALSRIEDGIYGICQGNHEPIPKERLKAIPWTRYCVACASLLERGLAKRQEPLDESDDADETNEQEDEDLDNFTAEEIGRDMKRIDKGFIFPSAAFTIRRGQIKFYEYFNKPPKPGDLVYGIVSRIGQHPSLENASGRIHMVHHGTKAIFVFANRYAPDFYEGLVPDEMIATVDLLAQSGIVGIVKTKNSMIKDPTKVRILGYVFDGDGNVLNTRNFPLIKPRHTIKKEPRSRMILVCGTSMNSGKSMAAAACCWALTSMRYKVRASKVTGTASLKDILLMNDAGASPYADFTYLGYPSTYLLPKEELLGIFNQLDLKYANNPKNFWVVEFADGIIQRETATLLNSPEVKSRIHKLIFCANDAFGAIGGLNALEAFGLKPDAISGICSSSPLHVRELSAFTDIPVFNSPEPNVNRLADILLSPSRQVLQVNPTD